MKSFFTVSFTTKRLTQTGDKSAYVATSVSGAGMLRQLDEKTETLNSIQFGEGYRMMIETSKDVVATDKLVIDSVEYEVRGMKSESMGSLALKELLLVKKKA